MSAKLFSTLVGIGALVGAHSAMAQPTIDPSGRDKPAPPSGGNSAQPPAGAVRGPVTAPPGSGVTQPGAAVSSEAEGGLVPSGDEGFYYYDEAESLDPREEGLTHQGGVPELHVVRTGDTLWDLCSFYFNNSWDWPRVWSYNPSITNPHWIYPGDVVRLQPAGQTSMAAAVVEEPAARTAEPRSASRSGFSLRQLTFVEREDLATSLELEGSEEEKVMLSTGDVVYLTYADGKPPQVGRRYAIYSETSKVNHPDTGRHVGSYVRVIGELEILSVKKDKRARGIIRESMRVIERGARVGPLQRTFKDVQPAANEKNLQGTIVGMFSGRDLIGVSELIVLDMGGDQGVQVGNRLFVARRGDARPDTGIRDQVGKDDRNFPAYAIAEVIVVEVGASTSLAYVTLSLQEAEVGDHVLMRKSK